MIKYLTSTQALFDERQRKRYSALQIVFIAAAVVQVLSVASIAPFIALLSKPSLIHEQPIFSGFYHALGFTNDRSFVIAFAFFLMVLVIISNAIPAATSWLVWSFAQKLGAEFQREIFRGYLYSDLSAAARINSAQRVQVLIHGVNRLIYMVVQPMLMLVSSSIVIALISGALLLYDPIVATSASLIVGGGYYAVYSLTRSRLAVHGKITWSTVESKQRLLSESLGGLKEIRLAGIADTYEESLSSMAKAALHSEAMVGLLADLPRYVLEAIALCSLLLLGIVLLIQNRDWGGIVAVLSIYAMAGYRLLPAVQTVFRSLSMIRANFGAVADIQNDVMLGRKLRPEDDRAVQAEPLPLEAPVVVEGVSYTYPGASKAVLSEVTFTIPRCAITALVGPSGAGKTTLADVIMGLVSPHHGYVRVGGRDVHSNIKEWHRRVSFVSQDVFLIDASVAENISFGSPGPVEFERLVSAARQASALDFIQRLPNGFDFGIGEHGVLLSGGQRQRLGIARALYNDADIIVLDEPTSALDPLTEREIMQTLQALRARKTIILITHKISALRDVDQIVLLEDGRVSTVGTYDDVSQRSPIFRRLASETASDPFGSPAA